jgi:hypothetical protein
MIAEIDEGDDQSMVNSLVLLSSAVSLSGEFTAGVIGACARCAL